MKREVTTPIAFKVEVSIPMSIGSGGGTPLYLYTYIYSYLYLIIRVPGINSDTPTPTVRPDSIDFDLHQAWNLPWKGPVELPPCLLGLVFGVSISFGPSFWSSHPFLDVFLNPWSTCLVKIC